MKAFAVLALLQAVAAKVSYDGYKVFHINVDADDYTTTREALDNLQYVSLNCESDHKSLEVAIAPDSLEAFEGLGFDAKLVTEDLGLDIASEGEVGAYETTSLEKRQSGQLPPASYFNAYQSFDGHLQYLKDLQAAFPQNSETFEAGKSGQGRSIAGIHLWGKNGKGKKPAVIWHGTVHAREWITAPTVEYLAYQIVSGYQKKDTLITNILDNFDFYVMPVVNPDGFVYTQTSDRLWRKNRQSRSGSSCVGTDVNRNWPWKWDTPGGSSTNACSETYRGEKAGDTPEMAVLTAHTQKVSKAQGIKFYVDWHSFSQLILLPYGYSCSAKFADLDRQMSLAKGVAGAIKAVNGLDFVYGPTCNTIYQTAGGSMDYVYDVAGAELAWSFEARPKNQAQGGFAIPASNIVLAGKEHWEGIRYLFQNW